MRFPRQVYLLLIVLFISPKLVENAKILAIFSMPAYSHFKMYKILIEGLVEKGHTVDVVSHFPSKNPPKGYNDISLAGTVPTYQNNLTVEEATQPNILPFILRDGGLEMCKSFFSTEVFNELKNSKEKYDLLLAEIFGTDCDFVFGHHFGIPTIGLTSSVDFPWGGSRIGNPDNPAYIPTYFSAYSGEMNLYERFLNTLKYVESKLSYLYYSLFPSNDVIKKHFGSQVPHLNILAQNVSLILVNSHFSINQARPVVPNFVEVGGLHIKKPGPLPQHFENLLKGDQEIIYFSTGSMVLAESFPLDKLRAICNVFKRLPFKILWKGSRQKFPKEIDIPENVHLEPWMPQLEILCHPKVALFITHGGLMGSQEAVYCGVPLLGIPLFADQELNIRQFESKGIALRVDYHDFREEVFRSTLTELLNNRRYRDNAKKLSALFRDRPQSPLETAVYWVDYVIRHKGAPQLRSKGADLAWHQYYLLDVLLIFIFLTLLLLKVVKVSILFVFKKTLKEKTA